MMVLTLGIALASRASVAEAERLSSEIASLEARGVWEGVEKTYRRAVQTGEPLAARVHVAGARASLQQGDADEARERLLAAYEIERDPSTLDWLMTFSREYARLNVRVDPGTPLEPERRPFDPDRARVVDRAAERLRTAERFDGLLPVGRYRLGSFWFRIEPDGADIIKDLRACTAAPAGCPQDPIDPTRGRYEP